MASFDGHAFCARCRDKGKGKDPCVETPQSDCKFCIVLTPEQLAQLATPSYKLNKEKREAKKLEATPSKDSTSVTQELSPPLPLLFLRRKLRRKSHLLPKSRNLPKSRTPNMMNLTKKWTDLFNRLEVAKTLQPAVQLTFSSTVRVAPLTFWCLKDI